MKKNYDELMQKMIQELEKKKIRPRLILHTCCAPCSTTAILELVSFFDITVFYYNPNIEPLEEYNHRKEEQIRFIKECVTENPVHFLECDYDNESFKKISCHLEHIPEGGIRCQKCFLLRLEKTAQVARDLNFDFFATTLTVSPHKNSQVINEIGISCEEKYGIPYLCSDFKKRNGYQKSIVTSMQYQLYRQNYCGCLFLKKNENE